MKWDPPSVFQYIVCFQKGFVYLKKNPFHAAFVIWGYFVILLLEFHKAWVQNGVLHMMKMDSSVHNSNICDGLSAPKNHECKALLYKFLQSFAVKIQVSVCPPIRWMYNVERSVPEPRKQF